MKSKITYQNWRWTNKKSLLCKLPNSTFTCKISDASAQQIGGRSSKIFSFYGICKHFLLIALTFVNASNQTYGFVLCLQKLEKHFNIVCINNILIFVYICLQTYANLKHAFCTNASLFCMLHVETSIFRLINYLLSSW